MNNARILIVRTDRIGDVVLSTPLPKTIKQKYPNSFVAVLVRDYTKDIYLNNPFVDEIIIADEDKISFFELAKKIRSKKFTHSLTLLPSEKINWILFLSGIKKRIGVGNKLYQFLTNTKSVYRNKYVPLRHETEYCLDEIRKIGITSESFDEEIYLTVAEKEKSEKFKNSVCPNDEIFIGINTTSGNSAPNLTVDEYAKLINELKKLSKIKLTVTDLNPPKDICEIEGVVYPNEGNSLRESVINFNSLDLLISSSTGPMHIAAGLKIKTLSPFCPLTACSPDLWGPKGNESYILLPEENYCKNKCPGDPKICNFSGAGGINSDIIIEKVKNIFNLK